MIEEVVRQCLSEIADESRMHGHGGIVYRMEDLCDGKLRQYLRTFVPKKGLNERIWPNGILNSEVRLRLLDIADDFISFINVPWVKPADVVITGSIANYNWSSFSDVDLHVMMDFSKVDERIEFVKEYFTAKKNEWNAAHDDLKIYGFRVELYVQDVDEANASTGVYSLYRNEWIKKPERARFNVENMQSFNEAAEMTCRIMRRIDRIAEQACSEADTSRIRAVHSRAAAMFRRLKKMRAEGLAENGEYSMGNIVFKILRRSEYLAKLADARQLSYDRMNSLR